YLCSHDPSLPSFPTRRSSDLLDCGKDNASRFLLRAASELASAPPIITFGWGKHAAHALELFQDGAVDFLEQPLDIQELRFAIDRSEEHTSELQSPYDLVCRLL